jgi:uncharacterized protein (TIGR04255 family)
MGMLANQSVTVEQLGWRFASEQGDLVVTVAEDSFAIETANYSAWEGDDGFRDELTLVCKAVEQLLDPAIESRVGLRYVNQVTSPSVREPAGWKEYISDEFLGPVINESVGPGVQGIESRASLDLGDGRLCLLRHGSFLDPVRPGLHTYLIDIDCYREGGIEFSSDGIISVADRLNSDCVAVFHAVVTEKLRMTFGQVSS